MSKQDGAWVVKVGRRKALAGLTWAPLAASDPASIRKEAKERARERGTRYAALIHFEGAEYALVGILSAPPKHIGLRVFGLPTVAGWFAASCERPTLYVERLESGLYWVLAASRFDFDLRTDVTLPAEKAAQLVTEIYEGWLAIGASPLVVAPPESNLGALGLPLHIRAGYLNSILSGSPPTHTYCRKIIGLPGWVPVVAVGVLAAGVAVSVAMKVRDRLAEARARAAAEAAAAQQAANAGIKGAQEAAFLAAQAQREMDVRLAGPAPLDAVDACIAAIDLLPDYLGGWRLDRAECQSDALIATYRADQAIPSSESTFRRDAATAGLDAGVEWFGTSGVVRQSFTFGPARPSIPVSDLPTTARAGEDLSSFYTQVNRAMPSTNGTFSKVKPVEMRGPNGAAVPAPFAEGQFTLTGQSTWQMRGAVPNRHYVRITNITVSSKYGTWTVAGNFLTSNKG